MNTELVEKYTLALTKLKELSDADFARALGAMPKTKSPEQS